MKAPLELEAKSKNIKTVLAKLVVYTNNAKKNKQCGKER